MSGWSSEGQSREKMTAKGALHRTERRQKRNRVEPKNAQRSIEDDLLNKIRKLIGVKGAETRAILF